MRTHHCFLNRSGTMSASGGSACGGKANAAANYTANALNQYTERTVHGSADILGSAEQDVTITVNEAEAARQAYYWYHRLTVDNLFNPVYTQVVVEAIYDPGTNDPYVVSSETGSVFVAESPEVFTYDDDGNMLSDGRFNYQWDGENRLIAVTTADGLPEDVPAVHIEFDYDYMSRRTGKTVYEWDDGVTNWVEQSSAAFLYDRWNLVREISTQDSEVSTNSYVFGLDLSGSLQGAGGIGGLLATVHGTNAYFVTYDANGNVSEYVDMSGDIAAHYEYSPFGETIVAVGDLAYENKFRFSTKPAEDNTGLVLYEYRAYSPSMGRWLSADPLLDIGSCSRRKINADLLEWIYRFDNLVISLVDGSSTTDELRDVRAIILALHKMETQLTSGDPRIPLYFTKNNLYGFCSNNGINIFDLLGLSECDIQKMRDTFRDYVDRLNREGGRRPGSGSVSGWINNLFGYRGCVRQTQDLLVIYWEMQKAGEIDYRWIIEDYRPWFGHMRGRARRVNHPEITFDPWANEFEPPEE